MDKIFFLTGACSPRTGGEFYNLKLYEYLEQMGLEPEYVDLYQKRKLFWLARIPILGYIFISLILVIILRKCEGILVEDHYFSKHLILANIVQRYVKKGRVILIVHHFDEYQSTAEFSVKSLINGLIEKVSLLFADKIVTVSEYSKKEIVSLGINPALISILSPGLDREKLEIPPNYEVELKKNKRILFVGNCTPRKGLIYLIEAFSQIDRQGFTLHIVGKLSDSNYSKKMLALVKDSGMGKEVFFYNRVSHEEINCLYASSDFFVLPSLKEGFGIVLLEAMYYGLPIISTDISAIPELVKDGMNGLLVPAANPQALAKAILKLIENPALRGWMGKRGRQKVTDSYYWNTTCSKFLSIIEDIKMAERKSNAKDLLTKSR